MLYRKFCLFFFFQVASYTTPRPSSLLQVLRRHALKRAQLLINGFRHAWNLIRQTPPCVSDDRIHKRKGNGVKHGSGANFDNLRRDKSSKVGALKQLGQQQCNVKYKRLIRIEADVSRDGGITYDEDEEREEDAKGQKGDASVDAVKRVERGEKGGNEGDFGEYVFAKC